MDASEIFSPGSLQESEVLCQQNKPDAGTRRESIASTCRSRDSLQDHYGRSLHENEALQAYGQTHPCWRQKSHRLQQKLSLIQINKDSAVPNRKNRSLAQTQFASPRGQKIQGSPS